MITYCDVIPNCTDCPRYGDDCDGDKRVEHAYLISRADAIETVHEYFRAGDGLYLTLCNTQSLSHGCHYYGKTTPYKGGDTE